MHARDGLNTKGPPFDGPLRGVFRQAPIHPDRHPRADALDVDCRSLDARRSHRPGTGGAHRPLLSSGSSDSGRRGRLFLRVECCVLPPVRDHWLTEPHAQLTELVDVLRCQVGVALIHELQRIFHPLRLLFRKRVDHAALPDRTEQLITCSFD